MRNIQLTSRMTDFSVLVFIGIVGIAVIAVVALRLWALPVWNVSGSFVVPTDDDNAGDIYIIRNYWPHRLIQPEWVGSTPDLFENWNHAEATARTMVVGIGWLVVTGGLIHILVKLRRIPPHTALQ